MIQNQYPPHERKTAYIEMRKLYIQKFGKDFPKIIFNLEDRGSTLWPQKSEHSMCYHHKDPERKILTGPDWTFYHWPSSKITNSTKTFEEIKKAGNSNPTIHKVAWFGNIKSAGPEVPEHKTRPLLTKLSQQYPKKFEFKHAGTGAKNSKIYISLPEMTQKYHCLLDIGGSGYSGRTKFLLFSNRPLLLIDRWYIEYWHNQLIPYSHYIPVNIDLSNLQEQYQWILDNKQKAKNIAQNALEFATQNFTLDKALNRMNEVFTNFISCNS